MRLVFNVDGALFKVPLRGDLRVIAGIFSGLSFPMGFGEKLIDRGAFLVRRVKYLETKELFLLFVLPSSAVDLLSAQLCKTGVITLSPELALGVLEIAVTRAALNGVSAALSPGMRFYQYCQLRFRDFVDVDSQEWQNFIQQGVVADQNPVPAAPAIEQTRIVIPVPRRPSSFISYEELVSRFPLLVQPAAWSFTLQVMAESSENFRHCLALYAYLYNLTTPEQLQILEYWRDQRQLCLFLESYERTCRR